MSGRDGREPKPCPVCGETCTYDGWDHVHRSGIGIGSCRPAAPAAEADLRAQIARALFRSGATAYDLAPDLLLALPALQRLVAEAAEARRLRETVARVRDQCEVLADCAIESRGWTATAAAQIIRVLDDEGTDG